MMKFLLIASLFFAHFISHAAVPTVEQENIGISNVFVDQSNSNAYNPRGLWLFGGLNTGYVTTSADPSQFDGSGFQMGIKGLASYYFNEAPWVAEGGLGFQLNRLTDAGSSANTDSLFIDSAGRYRINSSWQIGPTLSMLLGGNAGFAGFNEKSQSTAFLFGASAVYEMVMNDQYPFRVEGRLVTDLNVSGRQVYAALMGVQLGFPIQQGRSGTSTAEVKTSDVFADVEEFERAGKPEMYEKRNVRVATRAPAIPARKTNQVQKPIFVEETKSRNVPNNTRLAVKIPEISFKDKSVVMKRSEEEFFHLLAQRLEKESQSFGTIEIRGYADAGGNRELNAYLSTSRAKAVEQAMQVGGLPKRKIKVVASPAVAGNARRVEVTISDVKDIEKLNKVIQEVESSIN